MTTPQLGEPEYLCYQVIKQVREQHGEHWDLPETTFNKLSYIADAELREMGVDVGLPIHWYQYGGVLTDDAISGGFYDLVEQQWQENKGNNVVLSEDVSESDFDVEEERAAQIQEIAEGIVEELAGSYGIALSQDFQYEHYAPNDFVRNLHDFRDFLQDLDEEDALSQEEYVGNVDVSFSDIVSDSPSVNEPSGSASEDTNTKIRNHLDNLMTEYPEEQYSRMEDQFLEWENLSWQMAQNGFYSHLNDFMSSFWTTFSRVELRVKHNRNVPLEMRSHWKGQIEDEMESFQEEIEDYRNIVLENREETDVLDMVGESYSSTVRGMFNQST